MGMFTIYNENEDKFQLVEEPDSSVTYTYADYLKWKFEERVELLKGRIVKMSPAPNLRHQQISINLSARIYHSLEREKCQVFSAPFDVRLPVQNSKKDNEITTVVQPDICVVCDEGKLDERGCIGAPDGVIEILSPGNTEKETKHKFQLYEEAGVKEYGIVYPPEENIIVCILDSSGKFGGGKIYATNDAINSAALPGLTVFLKEIFTS